MLLEPLGGWGATYRRQLRQVARRPREFQGRRDGLEQNGLANADLGFAILGLRKA